MGKDLEVNSTDQIVTIQVKALGTVDTMMNHKITGIPSEIRTKHYIIQCLILGQLINDELKEM
jgi:hypothetical protein